MVVGGVKRVVVRNFPVLFNLCEISGGQHVLHGGYAGIRNLGRGSSMVKPVGASLVTRTIVCAGLSLILPAVAHGQGYPVKAIKMVVPNPPGGGADTIGRLVSEMLTGAIGQPVVVDNRGGAGGRIAMELVARSVPDGYTLLLATGSNLVTIPALYSKLSYEPLKDFSPISMAATTSYLLVAHPSVPAKSVKDLIGLAGARYGGLNYASTGPGTFAHLGGELLQVMAGIKATHIAFKGSASATLSLIQGETDIMFSNFIASLSLVRAKRLRAIGVTSLKRSSIVPDIPTIDESGLRGFEMKQFYSIWAPAKTNPEIIKRLNQEIVQKLPQVERASKLSADGTEITVSSPGELRKLVADEAVKWTKVIQKSGIKVEQ